MKKKLVKSKLGRMMKMSGTLAMASGKFLGQKVLDTGENLIQKSEKAQNFKAQAEFYAEIVKSMGELKGAVMKIGQMISITEDLVLPKEVSQLFKKLQKDAPPMSDDELNLVMSKNFGKHYLDIFSEFDPIPVAQASIGQVHKARLQTGEVVALKVQYPKIAQAVESDLTNVSGLYKVFSKLFPNRPEIKNMIEELADGLIKECDYLTEMENYIFFKQHLEKEFDSIYIPKVYPQYCTSEVLCLEFVEGNTFDETLNYSKEDLDFLSEQLHTYFFYSLFNLKKMHTDPQNGNYLFQKDKIIILDFGSTKEFSEDFIQHYKKLLIALESDDLDSYRSACLFLELAQDEDPIEHIQGHFDLVKNLYAPYLKPGKSRPTQRNPISEVKEFVQGIDMRKQKAPRSEFLMLDRALLGVFTKIRSWDGEINWSESIKKYR